MAFWRKVAGVDLALAQLCGCIDVVSIRAYSGICPSKQKRPRSLRPWMQQGALWLQVLRATL